MKIQQLDNRSLWIRKKNWSCFLRKYLNRFWKFKRRSKCIIWYLLPVCENIQYFSLQLHVIECNFSGLDFLKIAGESFRWNFDKNGPSRFFGIIIIYHGNLEIIRFISNFIIQASSVLAYWYCFSINSWSCLKIDLLTYFSILEE